MRLNGFGSSGMEEWIDWRAYERRGGTWAIQSMRGCPMSCIYCPFPSLEGRVSRCRPAEEVVDEIERVMSTCRPRTFEFVDSVFNIPQEHALSICETIIRRRLKVNLSAMGVYPSAVSEELFPLMKRAGFNSMMIAPEADPTDALFDVVVVAGLSRPEVVRHVGKLYSGRHLSLPQVRLGRGRSVSIACANRAPLEMDGEQPGALDASFELQAGAVPFVLPRANTSR